MVADDQVFGNLDPTLLHEVKYAVAQIIDRSRGLLLLNRVEHDPHVQQLYQQLVPPNDRVSMSLRNLLADDADYFQVFPRGSTEGVPKIATGKAYQNGLVSVETHTITKQGYAHLKSQPPLQKPLLVSNLSTFRMGEGDVIHQSKPERARPDSRPAPEDDLKKCATAKTTDLSACAPAQLDLDKYKNKRKATPEQTAPLRVDLNRPKNKKKTTPEQAAPSWVNLDKLKNKTKKMHPALLYAAAALGDAFLGFTSQDVFEAVDAARKARSLWAKNARGMEEMSGTDSSADEYQSETMSSVDEDEIVNFGAPCIEEGDYENPVYQSSEEGDADDNSMDSEDGDDNQSEASESDDQNAPQGSKKKKQAKSKKGSKKKKKSDAQNTHNEKRNKKDQLGRPIYKDNNIIDYSVLYLCASHNRFRYKVDLRSWRDQLCCHAKDLCNDSHTGMDPSETKRQKYMRDRCSKFLGRLTDDARLNYFSRTHATYEESAKTLKALFGDKVVRNTVRAQLGLVETKETIAKQQKFERDIALVKKADRKTVKKNAKKDASNLHEEGTVEYEQAVLDAKLKWIDHFLKLYQSGNAQKPATVQQSAGDNQSRSAHAHQGGNNEPSKKKNAKKKLCEESGEKNLLAHDNSTNQPANQSVHNNPTSWLSNQNLSGNLIVTSICNPPQYRVRRAACPQACCTHILATPPEDPTERAREEGELLREELFEALVRLIVEEMTIDANGLPKSWDAGEWPWDLLDSIRNNQKVQAVLTCIQQCTGVRPDLRSVFEISYRHYFVITSRKAVQPKSDVDEDVVQLTAVLPPPSVHLIPRSVPQHHDTAAVVKPIAARCQQKPPVVSRNATHQPRASPLAPLQQAAESGRKDPAPVIQPPLTPSSYLQSPVERAKAHHQQPTNALAGKATPTLSSYHQWPVEKAEARHQQPTNALGRKATLSAACSSTSVPSSMACGDARGDAIVDEEERMREEKLRKCREQQSYLMMKHIRAPSIMPAIEQRHPVSSLGTAGSVRAHPSADAGKDDTAPRDTPREIRKHPNADKVRDKLPDFPPREVQKHPNADKVRGNALSNTHNLANAEWQQNGARSAPLTKTQTLWGRQANAPYQQHVTNQEQQQAVMRHEFPGNPLGGRPPMQHLAARPWGAKRALPYDNNTAKRTQPNTGTWRRW